MYLDKRKSSNSIVENLLSSTEFMQAVVFPYWIDGVGQNG